MIAGYCLNVHLGESWKDLARAVGQFAIPLGSDWSGSCAYGLGLRLSGQAVAELARAEQLAEADQLFLEQPFRPFTVNAFPFGTFHQRPVKAGVYEPDWSKSARLEYTIAAARLLARWLGENQQGSVSTVPLGFRPARNQSGFLATCVGYLRAWVQAARAIEDQTGSRVILAIEPEPGCAVETTQELICFLEEAFFRSGGQEEELRRYVGICLDLCHAAVQFEDPMESLEICQQAGVAVAKIQVSNALSLQNIRESRVALASWNEPIYLHQVSARSREGEIRRWLDLPDALRDLERWGEGAEVRVHFHVPLTFQGDGPLKGTLDGENRELWCLLSKGVSSHLEVETYTFSVLPSGVRPAGLYSMLEGELAWLGEKLRSGPQESFKVMSGFHH